MKGKLIELESFQIIDSLVDLSKYSSEEAEVVRRIIHATGDVEYAELARFSHNAIDLVKDAIKKRWSVVCDVEMVKAGITERLAAEFGLELKSFINDKRVLELARKKGLTRAETSIEFANGLYDGIIFVIGNAPTALLKVIDLYKQNQLKNSVVIAFPVGFVKAAFSKEQLLKTSIPYITNVGQKGGSAVAAAAFRAVAKLL